MSVKVTVIIQREENWYVAKCVENSVASQGKSIEEAINNLTEALQLYYEDEDTIIEEHQTLVTTLEVAMPNSKPTPILLKLSLSLCIVKLQKEY